MRIEIEAHPLGDADTDAGCVMSVISTGPVPLTYPETTLVLQAAIDEIRAQEARETTRTDTA